MSINSFQIIGLVNEIEAIGSHIDQYGEALSGNIPCRSTTNPYLPTHGDSLTLGTATVGTSLYPYQGIHLTSTAKIYQGTTEFKAGGSGGGGLSNAELKSHLEKQLIDYPLSDPGICNESYTKTANIVITPRVNYTSGTAFVADINAASIDAMTSYLTWTVGTNTPTLANETTIALDGTSIKMSKSSLPAGSMTMYKSFTAFSLVDKQIAFSLYLDVLTNVTRAFITLETTSGNDKTWYIPVASLTAATWAHITINPNTDTADATTGTFNPASITKITFGVTVSSSQTINSYWDIVNSVDTFTIVDSTRKYMSYIWNTSTQEPIYFNSVAGTGIHQRNTYTITALSNAYSVGSTYAKERNVTISGNQGIIPSGLSGAAAKTTYDIKEYWLPKSVSNQDITTSWRFWDEEFKVSSVSSTTETKVTSSTDKSAYFLSGDQIILYQKQNSGTRYQSKYTSAITTNFKVLTLTSNSTYSSSEITLPHTGGSNSGADTNYWYVTRFSVKKLAKLEAMASNGALAYVTPLACKISNSNPIFSDNFTRTNETPPTTNGWATGTDNGITGSLALSGNIIVGTGGGNNSHGWRLYRVVENYQLNEVEITYSMSWTQGSVTNYVARQGVAIGTTNAAIITGYNTSTFAGLTVHFNKDNGAGQQNNNLIQIYNGNTLVNSISFTYAYQTTYSVKIQKNATNVKVKIWDSATSEPIAWNVNYTHSSTWNYSGTGINWFCECGTAAVDLVYAYFDNFVYKSIATGYYLSGKLTAASGDKLVDVLEYSRQDTTNQNPAGYQSDSYVPGLTE